MIYDVKKQIMLVNQEIKSNAIDYEMKKIMI